MRHDTGRQPPRPARRRHPDALSRERILGAALDLVDREGAAALSMRNVGRALGVEAMSLYHHVAHREDLLDGLADTLVAAGLPVAAADQPWDAAVRDFATGIRRTGLAHPAAFQLVGMRPLRGDAALDAVVALLERLHASGFTPGDAVATYRLTAAYARGFVLAEISGLTLAAATAEARPTGDASAPAAFLPSLSADPGEAFTAGLEMIVAGAGHRLASARSPA